LGSCIAATPLTYLNGYPVIGESQPGSGDIDGIDPIEPISETASPSAGASNEFNARAFESSEPWPHTCAIAQTLLPCAVILFVCAEEMKSIPTVIKPPSAQPIFNSKEA
jgi:hypothetical protein